MSNLLLPGSKSHLIFFIQEAAQALLSAALAGSKLPNIINKANEYILRAEELKKASKCVISTCNKFTPVLVLQHQVIFKYFESTCTNINNGNYCASMYIYVSSIG